MRFKTATVKFYTQPFKYLKDEKPVELEITDETSIVVNNVGLEIAKPIITLKGSGLVEISVNNSAVFNYTFPEDETEVIIDSIEEEAYLDGIYKNRNMIGSFPKLEIGKNTIKSELIDKFVTLFISSTFIIPSELLSYLLKNLDKLLSSVQYKHL